MLISGKLIFHIPSINRSSWDCILGSLIRTFFIHNINLTLCCNTVQPAFSKHLWDNENVLVEDRCLLGTDTFQCVGLF